MPVPGKDTAKALAAVEAALAHEDAPGTILFLTDGVEAGAVESLRAHDQRHAVIVLGIGTAEGGPVRTGAGAFLSEAGGQRVFSRLDVDALRQLKSQAGVEVATVTADDADVQWVQRHVQSHLRQQQADAESRWRDMGWYLLVPIIVLAALWFRRGWTIRWFGALLLATMLSAPGPSQAADVRWLNPWLTPDQQGRLAFERGDYAAAAERFADPMWRGVALYRAGHFAEAVESFARIDSATSDYNQGNALARLGRLDDAAVSYQRALKRRPDDTNAKANLALVERLIALAKKKEKEDEQGEPPDIKPDQIQFDDLGKKGKRGPVPYGSATAEMWMRNIQTTPAELLRRKFALQVQQAEQPKKP
jgi:Ca-activated chloride channel family protein